ncbi:hypothetical protein [Chitinophaga solisilvae]|uniref:hypothetical protein n=1 Tax=Chitinophaga solisilvae TaxID=1233460 RepID=UPI00136BF786|nr:hypothetical protein [Chitinophaga solisilvae]
MQHFRVWLALAAIGFTACNQGTNNKNANAADTATALQPATPAGSVAVVISGKEKDTQEITIKFQIKELKKEKTFEQVVLKDAAESELYKVLWDEPNSCYIGVLKPNHAVRYYHASQSGDDLKILWATAPPERIWKYMENTMGLGKVSAAGDLKKSYRKNFQSGKIIADFIAEIKPDATTKDSVELYVEFGGVRKSMFVPVPAGYQPTIQETANQDHIYFSLVKDGKVEPFIDMKVEDGRLQVQTLKKIEK